MDPSSLIILLTGLGLGLGHSIDPDHVIAVSALVCNNRSIRRCVSSAVVWGLGHSAVLLIVGFAVLTLRVAIPEGVVNLFEFAAATLLIILGTYVLSPIVMEKIFKHPPVETHSHTHSHDGQIHTHTHTHEGHSHVHLHKSALTGALQGLGGSSALMLVVLTTVPSADIGIVFIILFGAGVILGMVGISCIVGSVIKYTASNFRKINEAIKALTGTASIAIGVYIILSLVI